jgi:hypothetical protein
MPLLADEFTKKNQSAYVILTPAGGPEPAPTQSESTSEISNNKHQMTNKSQIQKTNSKKMQFLPCFGY